MLKTAKAKVNPLPGSNDIYVRIPHNHAMLYLIIEVRVLGVMQDCGTGCGGEDWTSRLAVDALEKQQQQKKGKNKVRLSQFLMKM